MRLAGQILCFQPVGRWRKMQFFSSFNLSEASGVRAEPSRAEPFPASQLNLFFVLKSGMVKMEFVGDAAAVRAASKRAKPACSCRLSLQIYTKQAQSPTANPFISGKKSSRFLLARHRALQGRAICNYLLRRKKRKLNCVRFCTYAAML